MKATRGWRTCNGGTLQKQVMRMDLDVYWCDGSVRERWKLNVPSTITRSINGLDSQNRSRTEDLVISIINNQHPLKRRTNKKGLERMRISGRFIRSLAMNGTCTATTLQCLQHPFFKASELLILLIQSSFGTFLSRNDEPFGLVLAFKFHVRLSEIVRKVESLNRLATNFSEPSQGGFFDVLTARNSLEKKS